MSRPDDHAGDHQCARPLGLVVGKENRADGYTRENVTRQLDQYEQYGVTTMMSLGLNRDLVYELRDEQRQGKLSGATIFTAGRGLGVPSGFPPMPVAADQLYRPRTADEARADVRSPGTAPTSSSCGSTTGAENMRK